MQYEVCHVPSSCSSNSLNTFFPVYILKKSQTFTYRIYGKITKCFLSWKLGLQEIKQNHSSNELKQLKFKPRNWNSLKFHNIWKLLLWLVVPISYYLIWHIMYSASFLNCCLTQSINVEVRKNKLFHRYSIPKFVSVPEMKIHGFHEIHL